VNQLTLNAIAVGIFAMTSSVLLGPFLNISPVLPAGLTLLILSAVTFDSFRFQSIGLTVALDTLAQLFPPYRHRVLRHEAGHFLVAYLLGLPIDSYTLSVREACQRGLPAQAGLVLVEPQTDRLQWLHSNIVKLCAVWSAGGIAEELNYGSAQGNEDDLQQLRSTLKALHLSPTLYERQAKKEAKQLIQQHWRSYEALVTLLEQRCSVVDCCKGIEQAMGSPSTDLSGSKQT
jgi:hypothetical protein